MAEIVGKNPPEYRYTGEKQPTEEERNASGGLLSPYRPDTTLVEAVNLAILLKRPLLIKGEPGSGKTRLARAVAYELYKDYPYELSSKDYPYEAWHVKSTSRARDGLYTYDTVARLRDAQLAALKHLKEEDIPLISDPTNYVNWGPLGKAFRNEQHRVVVLIDEIDKAEIDFPTDLLWELDERHSRVEETGEPIKAKHAPIVFITSNDQKDLPDEFLRRCLFYHIKFPDAQRLVEIVNLHFPDVSRKLVEATVSRFVALRQEMDEDKGASGKKVSTSELLDWFHVLSLRPADEEEIIAKLENDELPYPSVLLKSEDDQHRYLPQPDVGELE